MAKKIISLEEFKGQALSEHSRTLLLHHLLGLESLLPSGAMVSLLIQDGDEKIRLDVNKPAMVVDLEVDVSSQEKS